MALIIFLLAYIIRRRLDTLDTLHSDQLWRRWFHRAAKVEAGHERSLGAGLAMVLLPALVLGIGDYLLVGSGWWLAVYPMELLVLVVMMGVPGWRGTLTDYSRAWRSGDMQAAWRYANGRLRAEERGAALSPEVMHLALSRAMMRAVFDRFFLIAFWYVIGGVGAAVLARGLVALVEQWPQAPARPKFAVAANLVAWLPARLLALTFGLAGDLAGWLRKLRLLVKGSHLATGELLMMSADGALTGYALDPSRFSRLHPEEWSEFGGRSLTALRDLLNRSMLVWICAIALLVISGLI